MSSLYLAALTVVGLTALIHASPAGAPTDGDEAGLTRLVLELVAFATTCASVTVLLALNALLVHGFLALAGRPPSGPTLLALAASLTFGLALLTGFALRRFGVS